MQALRIAHEDCHAVPLLTCLQDDVPSAAAGCTKHEKSLAGHRGDAL